MASLEIFDALHLSRLPPTWVDSTWNNQFLILESLPEDYVLAIESAEADLESVLGSLIKHLKTCIQSQEAEFSWQTLRSLNVPVRPLLALIGYLIKTGQTRNESEDARQSCLLGTSLYLTLLSIPGSIACEVFHENLFQLALDTLSLSEALVAPKCSKTPQDEDELPSTLSQTQKKNLTESLNTIMFDIIVFLEQFSLLDLPRSLESTISALIEVTKLETEKKRLLNNGTSSPQDSTHTASLGTLNNNAYAALTAICSSRHGDILDTIKLIIKNILIFMTPNAYNNLNVKLLANVRKTTIHFLETLVNAHQEAAEEGVRILMGLIMVNPSKMAPDRQKEVAMLIELLKTLKSQSSRNAMVRDLVRFSHNIKIPFRIFAQEIIGKYVLMGDNDVGSPEDRNLRKILLGTVLLHCNDISSLVRAKCLSTLSEYTEDENLFVKDLFEFRNEDLEVAGVDELEEAFDSLTEELDILPDENAMIAMLKDRVEDERAAVRTSTMQILRNSVRINKELLRTAVDAVSLRCRDPTMTVRKGAIKVLTSLFESFPDDNSLCTTWVKSVVPQVFDVEIQVQAAALTALESLTIERMSSRGRREDLPWRVLRELSRNKMRKHLAKACEAWVKAETLTSVVVRNVKSQIGSEHNSEVWILLSAISEAQILEGMQEHFVDYEAFFEADGFLEPVFEVLRSCWSTFDDDFTEKLHQVFLDHLNSFRVHERLISISLDIVHEVSESLKSSGKLTRPFADAMADLVTSSESIITSMMDHESPETLCRRSIFTLGHASLLCTKEPSLSVLRILQGLLIDPETIPAWVQDTQCLQACTIIVLGQQSMRKESLAREMTTIFAQLLTTSSSDNPQEDAAIRVNAAKALADVATRFTSLVEPHLPDMCVSMKDPNPIVREAIVIIFIQLLVEDYIMAKGNFFFHILTMLADDESTIREMTVFLVKERLLMKNKDIITQQFLEAIFHYNDFDIKNKFSKRKMKDHEKMALVLKGGDNERRRRIIYDFMMENVELAGKEKLNRILTVQILNRFISGNFKIKVPEAYWVLRDALYVISSDHLMVGTGGRGQGEEEEEAEGGRVSNTQAVILEKLRSHRLTVLLPTLGELRRKMAGSKVEGEVGRAFVKVSGEFGKEQLSGLFAEYPAVEGEMEHNMR